MDPSDEHVTEVELSPVGSPPSKPWGHRHGAMAVAALVAGAVLISGASGGGHALSTSELADFAGPELPEDDDRDSGRRRRVIRWEEYGPDEPAERDPIETFDSDEMAIEIDPYDDTTTTLDPLLVDPWVPPEYDDTFPPEDDDWDGPIYTVPPRQTPPRATVPPRRTATTSSSTTTSTSSTTSSSTTTTTTLAPGTGTTSTSSTSTSLIVPLPPGQMTTTSTTPPYCHLTTTTTATTLPLGITIPPVVLPDWMITTTTTQPCVTTTTTTTTTTPP